MSLLLTIWAATSLALAAPPEILVVGLHLPGTSAEAQAKVATDLTAALDATGKADGVAPEEVGKRLAGREGLILDQYAFGAGKARLQEAKVLYGRAQFEEALPVAEEAVALLQEGMAISTDIRDLQEALIVLGQVKLATSDNAGAAAAFARSAVLDPMRQLDEVNYPPQVVEAFGGARAQVTAQKPATLTLSGADGSKVWLDGREVGVTPLTLSAAPGEHYLLVRGEKGASDFTRVAVGAGEQRALSIETVREGMGLPASDNSGKSRQIRDLYRSLGQYTGTDPVLVGGVVGGEVVLQLYSPLSGNFSKPVRAEAGSNPAETALEIAPALASYIAENGDIKPDRVSPSVLALDVAGNAVLYQLLFEPAEPETKTIVVEKRPRWVWFAGAGLLVGGGAVTAALLLQPEDNPTVDPDQGTITLEIP